MLLEPLCHDWCVETQKAPMMKLLFFFLCFVLTSVHQQVLRKVAHLVHGDPRGCTRWPIKCRSRRSEIVFFLFIFFFVTLIIIMIPT